MFKKDQQRQRDLFESERNFRLLVEGVADCALYMLDPGGVVTSWNIGGVAHDFNNLLMIISGSLHTLKKAVGDDPKCQRALSAIEGATKRGASLTSQLLTFARRQSVNPQAVDVAEHIDAVREVLDTGVGSAVMLQFDIDPGVWPVMVDIAEFETALVNLVINARDAMAGGGVITISAHN